MSKKLNVLIVDDSLIMRKNLFRNLDILGHHIIAEAKDGQESIDLYKRHQPDLVTMDITMPGMDGITALEKIKEIDSDANIIMVTSHGQESMVMMALKAGSKGYILKPVTPDKLREAIGRIFFELAENYEEELLDE
ncbi:MAG: response regulator [gamma proteobacterium symbiont of Taylorina sp.]|nr:response regulator [gamma proteobacterium symbiont of Taylorina sp.]